MGWSFNGTSTIQGYFGYQLSTFDGQRAKYDNDTGLTQRITSVSIQMEAGHSRFHWYGADVKGSGDIENFYITITDSTGSKKTSNKVTISDTIESSYDSTTGDYYFDYSDVDTTYTFKFSDYPVVYAGATVYVDFAALKDSAVMPGHVLCFNKNNGKISGTTLPNTYTIIFDPNDGTGGPGTQTKIHGTNLVVSNIIPTRTGYTFNGWNTKSNGTGYTVQPGGTITADESKTMYAIWVAKLTVNYYSNFATSSFSGADNQVSSSSNVIVRSFTFTDTTAYPYGLHDYKNSGDGTYLARIGYTATGNWGTTIDGGTLVSQSTGFDSGQALAKALGTTLTDGNTSINVFAQWTANKYTITYNGNGGLYNGATTWSESVTYGTDYTTRDNFFDRPGYTFTGWVDQNGTDWTNDINNPWKWSYTYNVTLYAQWEAKTVKVTFNKNDNSGDTASQSFTYAASGNRFGYNTDGTLEWGNSGQFGAWDRIGYTLLGWSENPNDTDGSYYSIYSSVADWWINSNSPRITLYAIWQKNYYAGVSPDITKSSNWKDSHLYVKDGSKWKVTDDTYIKKGSLWKEGTL